MVRLGWLITLISTLWIIPIVSASAAEWTVTRVMNDPAQSIGFSDVEADSTGRFLVGYSAGSPGSSAVDYQYYARTSTDGEEWSEPMIVSAIPGNNRFVDVEFLSDDRSVIAWNRQRIDGKTFDIFAAEEIEPGEWEVAQITDDQSDDARAQIAVLSDDTVAVAFPSDIPAGGEVEMDICLAVRNGNRWAVQALTDNLQDDHRPMIAADRNDRLHIVYPRASREGGSDRTQGGWDLYYITNQSGTWSAPLNLTQACGLPDKADFCSLLVDAKNHLHCLAAAGDSAAGDDREAYHLTDESGQWVGEQLSKQAAPVESIHAALGPDGSIHAVYQVGRVFRQSGTIPTSIHYQKRSTAGVWSAPEEIEDAWEDSENPAVAVSRSNRIVVSYQAVIQGAYQLIAATAQDTPAAVETWKRIP